MKMIFEEATCGEQELENRKEVKKEKIDFTGARVQRKRKTKRHSDTGMYSCQEHL